MSFVQIVFSPTGGTKKAADMIMASWEKSVDTVDLTDEKSDFGAICMEKNDVAVIAVPSYGGRVPALAAERIARIHGNQAKCVLVCVYGNRAYEDTLAELYDIAEKCGFRVTAAVSAVSEHSIMHQYAAGRPDTQDEKELYEFGRKILKKVGAYNVPSMAASSIPGNRPYKKANGVGLVPKGGGRCTECGLCAKNCPAQAISRENLKTADRKKCISCMRCVVQCPHAARKVNGLLVTAASFAMRKACQGRKANELFYET